MTRGRARDLPRSDPADQKDGNSCAPAAINTSATNIESHYNHMPIDSSSLVVHRPIARATFASSTAQSAPSFSYPAAASYSCDGVAEAACLSTSMLTNEQSQDPSQYQQQQRVPIKKRRLRSKKTVSRDHAMRAGKDHEETEVLVTSNKIKFEQGNAGHEVDEPSPPPQKIPRTELHRQVASCWLYPPSAFEPVTPLSGQPKSSPPPLFSMGTRPGPDHEAKRQEDGSKNNSTSHQGHRLHSQKNWNKKKWSWVDIVTTFPPSSGPYIYKSPYRPGSDSDATVSQEIQARVQIMVKAFSSLSSEPQDRHSKPAAIPVPSNRASVPIAHPKPSFAHDGSLYASLPRYPAMQSKAYDLPGSNFKDCSGGHELHYPSNYGNHNLGGNDDDDDMGVDLELETLSLVPPPPSLPATTPGSNIQRLRRSATPGMTAVTPSPHPGGRFAPQQQQQQQSQGWSHSHLRSAVLDSHHTVATQTTGTPSMAPSSWSQQQHSEHYPQYPFPHQEFHGTMRPSTPLYTHHDGNPQGLHGHTTHDEEDVEDRQSRVAMDQHRQERPEHAGYYEVDPGFPMEQSPCRHNEAMMDQTRGVLFDPSMDFSTMEEYFFSDSQWQDRENCAALEGHESNPQGKVENVHLPGYVVDPNHYINLTLEDVMNELVIPTPQSSPNRICTDKGVTKKKKKKARKNEPKTINESKAKSEVKITKPTKIDSPAITQAQANVVEIGCGIRDRKEPPPSRSHDARATMSDDGKGHSKKAKRSETVATLPLGMESISSQMKELVEARVANPKDDKGGMFLPHELVAWNKMELISSSSTAAARVGCNLRDALQYDKEPSRLLKQPPASSLLPTDTVVASQSVTNEPLSTSTMKLDQAAIFFEDSMFPSSSSSNSLTAHASSTVASLQAISTSLPSNPFQPKLGDASIVPTSCRRKNHDVLNADIQ